MEPKNGCLHEVAELLIQLIVQRLSAECRKGLARPTEADGHSKAVEHLTAWLGQNIPEYLLSDLRVDVLGLVQHCCALLYGYSSKDLASVLGLADSEITVPGPAQARLFVPLQRCSLPSTARRHCY
jgi:hypothetical protein